MARTAAGRRRVRMARHLAVPVLAVAVVALLPLAKPEAPGAADKWTPMSPVTVAFETNGHHPSSTVTSHILSFNDFHGAIDPPIGSGAVVNGTPAGGAEYLGYWVKKLRAEAKRTTPYVYTVAAGDNVGATPLVSAAFHDEPAIEVLNAIGLDISSVGNHEYDEGVKELERLQRGGCHPVDGCQDGDGFRGADFEYLAANVVKKSTGLPHLAPITLRWVGGVLVGFVGMTLKGTPSIVNPAGITHGRVQGRDRDRQLLRRPAQALPRRQGDGPHDPRGRHPEHATDPDRPVELRELRRCDHADRRRPAAGVRRRGLRAHAPLLHVRAAELGRQERGHQRRHQRPTGHRHHDDARPSHEEVRLGERAQPDQRERRPQPGRHLADHRAGRVRAQPRHGRPQVKKIADKYRTAVAPIANRVVGSISADIVRDVTPASNQESPLGDVIADAQLRYTQASAGAQIALMNPGGIRASLSFAFSPGGEAPGQVTYGEAFTVQPFNNLVVTQTFTGAQIKDVLEQQFPIVNGALTLRILQVSAGFTYTYNSTPAAGSRISDIRLNGTPIDPAATYRVTTNDFLANGGDGFTALTAGTNRVTAPGFDVDALVAHLATGPIGPGPGEPNPPYRLTVFPRSWKSGARYRAADFQDPDPRCRPT